MDPLAQREIQIRTARSHQRAGVTLRQAIEVLEALTDQYRRIAARYPSHQAEKQRVRESEAELNELRELLALFEADGSQPGQRQSH
jgi:hypothetical protein